MYLVKNQKMSMFDYILGLKIVPPIEEEGET